MVHTWKATKTKFKLEKSGRSYDFRHTFATNVTKQVGVKAAAKIIGDQPDTLMKCYLKYEIDETRPALSKILNGSVMTEAIDKEDLQQLEVVQASEVVMPESIKQAFIMFNNGKTKNIVVSLHN